MTIPAQLRRRREASRRMPVLADRRRDPIDPVRPSRAVVTVRQLGRFTTAFEGPGVTAAIDTLGIKFIRKPGGVIWVSFNDAEDLLALLEHRGHKIDVGL